MRNINYKWFWGIGLILCLIGVILPLLMVVKVIESTYFLNFFAYSAGLVGMIFGILGAAFYTAKHRKRKTSTWEDVDEDENHHS